jgi:hypothetical protein
VPGLLKVKEKVCPWPIHPLSQTPVLLVVEWGAGPLAFVQSTVEPA